MRLVDHHHDVAAVAKRLIAVGELLHGGEHDAVGFAPDEQFLQILAAGRLYWRLAQEVLAAPELPEQLVVQVVAVGDHRDGGAVEARLQKMREEHH